MPTAKTRHHFFLALLTLSGVLFFLVFKPHANAIILGAALAALSHPAYVFLTRLVKYKSLAALVTITVLLTVVLIPFIFFGFQAIREAQNVYADFIKNGGLSGVLNDAFGLIAKYLPGLNQEKIHNDLNSFASGIVQKIIENLVPLFSGVVSLVIQIIISLIICFFFLKDGGKISKFIIEASPLSDKDDEKIIDRIKRTVSSVIHGTIVIAVLQGLLMGVGFWLFGVRNPVLWGGVTMLASLIPGVGTAIITLPSAAFLFYQNHLISAILILVWGTVIVGFADNIIRPYLIKKDLKIHQFIILLSILGGLKAFGPIGLIMGPLVVSLFLALLDVYAEVM